MRAEIISIGTEILLGHIVNTNSAYLSKKLAHLGIDLFYHTTVGDNPKRLVSTIEKALSRSDVVFTTGGLGPTVDDITLSGISEATSNPLTYNKKIEKYIKLYFKKRKLKKMPKEAFRQAFIPQGAVWFENKMGTAPAILIKTENKLLVALPGPPRELIPLFEEKIVPFLKDKGFAGKYLIKTKTLKVTGIPEVSVNKKIKDLLNEGPDTTLGIYVHLGEVDLKITSKAKSKSKIDSNIKRLEKLLRKRLGNYIYGEDKDTLESVVGKLLTHKKKTLSIAESCTGGLLANRITNVSGSSKYFKMGLVAYSDKVKTKFLKVPNEKLKKYGAVSKEVALCMAEGIKKLAETDVSVGITGIAGPRGKTKNKPVGLVYIAIINNKTKLIKECHFHGSREDIKHLSTITALNLVRASLK